jgi:hypothetical protein
VAENNEKQEVKERCTEGEIGIIIAPATFLKQVVLFLKLTMLFPKLVMLFLEFQASV